MPGNGYKTIGSRVILWVTVFLCLVSGSLMAGEQTERRILVGLKLFPAVLAADRNLENKIAPDGKLHVLVVYKERPDAAERVAMRLREAGAIRDIPLVVETVAYTHLNQRPDHFAGLFLAEWLPDALPAATHFGNTTGTLVFSPFRGDVALGAHAGVFIGDRILPLVNPASLSAAGIQLKSFFLEVARTHE